MYCKDYVAKELAKCLPQLTEEQVWEGIEIPKEKPWATMRFRAFAWPRSFIKRLI